ncbi:MAG: ABC transporter ATP-binding protein [Eubacteriales bacterium]|nr:ABC transporter ATP-binding protein [Clostridia bacterium]MDY2845418.1 ABC transporter ATP-binding protein [Eubacteriales bacterium]
MPDAIKLVGVTKTFGKIIANNNINMTVRQGEILSLLGENGSGKTTLMNILSGIYYPDEGQIFVGGNEVTISSPKDSFDLGIGMIHQHFKLVDVFTAAENIILGLPGKQKLDMKSVEKKITEICSRYGFDIDPKMKVYEMTVSQKQTLEIVKVLYRGANILILDEPTAVLTPQETEKLFNVMREMKRDGKTVIIITHKLHEVLAVSDRVAILRKGEYIGTVETKDATELSLTEMMVGKKVSLDIERPVVSEKHKRISVENLTVIGPEDVPVLKNVSFDAYSGEILGIAGISGCGQKELLEAIAGLQHPVEGSRIDYIEPRTDTPESLIGKTPREIKELGITLSFVPEDRLGMGLVASMGMADNMMLKSYEKGKSIFVERNDPKKLAEDVKEELSVVTPGINTPVRRLSGGNVQKVLVGREIAAAPSVLMTAYAVRGLDINTSYMIYHLLNEQKEKGVAVIYVGEDLDVLIDLCDRILVLCAGQVTGIVNGGEVTKEQLGLLMTKISGGKE